MFCFTYTRRVKVFRERIMKYRADIDGLRSIAIIPVILFHAKLDWIRGGYVGVDVFFAISGFLITSIIYPKIIAQQFSFTDFYLRRARRLLPAGYTVVLFSVLSLAFVYPPDQFSILIHSAVSSILFVSNIFFWQTSGYFSPSLELQPLLHTWSLSVEEQFYFLFPAFLVIAVFFRAVQKFIIPIIILACLISLALSVKYAPNSMSFVGFYVLPTRFYEMGLGALLAILMCHGLLNPTRRLYLREIGIILITLAVFSYNSKLAFPSYYALLPVLGTLLVIADKSQDGVCHHLLCSKPVVFVGLISYSLYLWHWPLLVIINWYWDIESPVMLIAYFALTFLFAYLSYQFIERPFRNPQTYSKPIMRNTANASVIVFIASISYFTVYKNDEVINLPSDALAIYKVGIQNEPYRDECTDVKRLKGYYEICQLHQSHNAKYKILLWGDSHASALMSALVEFSEEINVDAFNTSGCPSLVGIHRKRNQDCYKHNEFIKEYLQSNPKEYDLVLNVSAWNNYIDLDLLEIDGEQNTERALGQGIKLTESFYEQTGIRSLFIAQFPKQETHIPEHYFRAYEDADITSIERESHDIKTQHFRDYFKNSWVIDFDDSFCDDKKCYGYNKDHLYYQDAHHISVRHAQIIAKQLESEIIRQLIEWESQP